MPVSGQPVLTTPRLLIRRITPDDEGAMLSVYGDAEAMRWVDDGTPIAPDACRRWIRITLGNYESRGYGMFACAMAQTGEVVGFCGLVHPGGQAEPELKYAFERTHWGHGYASEAARGLLRYGFTTLGLDEIISTVAAEHAASINVLEKLGMRHSDDRREADGSVTRVYRLCGADFGDA